MWKSPWMLCLLLCLTNFVGTWKYGLRIKLREKKVICGVYYLTTTIFSFSFFDTNGCKYHCTEDNSWGLFFTISRFHSTLVVTFSINESFHHWKKRTKTKGPEGWKLWNCISNQRWLKRESCHYFHCGWWGRVCKPTNIAIKL